MSEIELKTIIVEEDLRMTRKHLNKVTEENPNSGFFMFPREKGGTKIVTAARITRAELLEAITTDTKDSLGLTPVSEESKKPSDE